MFSELFRGKEIEEWDKDYSVGFMPSMFISQKRSKEEIEKENKRFRSNGYRYQIVSGGVDGWIARPF